MTIYYFPWALNDTCVLILRGGSAWAGIDTVGKNCACHKAVAWAKLWVMLIDTKKEKQKLKLIAQCDC